MIPLDGQIKNAVIGGVTSPHGGGLSIPISGTISEIKAELVTQSKEKVKVGMILGLAC